MIKNNKKINLIKILGFSAISYIIPFFAKAASIECAGDDESKEYSEGSIWGGKSLLECRVCGDCSLTDFVQLGTNIFQFVLGIVGSLALLAFVYGGILFLASGGNTDMIEKGKSTLKGATIGLIIVFTSYMIVYFVAQTLGVEGPGGILQSGGF